MNIFYNFEVGRSLSAKTKNAYAIFGTSLRSISSLSGVHINCGEGNGNPLQYSCLENPMDRGAWWAAVHGVAESRTRLSNFTFTFYFHALEKEMATHSCILALENPRDRGAWWAAIYGVAQGRTQLKRLRSSSSSNLGTGDFSKKKK